MPDGDIDGACDEPDNCASPTPSPRRLGLSFGPGSADSRVVSAGTRRYLGTMPVTELRIGTSAKREMIDLTARVAEIVAQSGVAHGLCSVYVPHATAAIVVNENDDPNVCVDVLDALDRLIPAGIWRHDRVDGNAAAHIQATILGPGETLPVHQGRLTLGTWQAVMLVELDGPRTRRVIVTVL